MTDNKSNTSNTSKTSKTETKVIKPQSSSGKTDPKPTGHVDHLTGNLTNGWYD